MSNKSNPVSMSSTDPEEEARMREAMISSLTEEPYTIPEKIKASKKSKDLPIWVYNEKISGKDFTNMLNIHKDDLIENKLYQITVPELNVTMRAIFKKYFDNQWCDRFAMFYQFLSTYITMHNNKTPEGFINIKGFMEWMENNYPEQFERYTEFARKAQDVYPSTTQIVAEWLAIEFNDLLEQNIIEKQKRGIFSIGIGGAKHEIDDPLAPYGLMSQTTGIICNLGLFEISSANFGGYGYDVLDHNNIAVTDVRNFDISRYKRTVEVWLDLDRITISPAVITEKNINKLGKNVKSRVTAVNRAHFDKMGQTMDPHLMRHVLSFLENPSTSKNVNRGGKRTKKRDSRKKKHTKRRKNKTRR